MGVEIERKFLIDLSYNLGKADSIYDIKQGYILNSKDKVVRVRITDDKSYITVKGQNTGASRPEFEYEIPKEDAQEMMDTMCTGVISKTRYIYQIGDVVWEIDSFHGDNKGLVVAEVEIPSEDYNLNLPRWVSKEVTNEVKYYNNSLIKYPYKLWTTEDLKCTCESKRLFTDEQSGRIICCDCGLENID